MTSTPPPAVVRPPIDFSGCETVEQADDLYRQLFAAYDCASNTDNRHRVSEAHRLCHVRFADARHSDETREQRQAEAEERRATKAAARAANPRSAGGKVQVRKANGTRITLADLIAAELLTAGDRLEWHYHGTTHTASVTADGQMAVNGPTEHRWAPSLSDAAKLANGGGSFNGWKCWQVPATYDDRGTTITEAQPLADLRAKLQGE